MRISYQQWSKCLVSGPIFFKGNKFVPTIGSYLFLLCQKQQMSFCFSSCSGFFYSTRKCRTLPRTLFIYRALYVVCNFWIDARFQGVLHLLAWNLACAWLDLRHCFRAETRRFLYSRYFWGQSSGEFCLLCITVVFSDQFLAKICVTLKCQLVFGCALFHLDVSEVWCADNRVQKNTELEKFIDRAGAQMRSFVCAMSSFPCIVTLVQGAHVAREGVLCGPRCFFTKLIC